MNSARFWRITHTVAGLLFVTLLILTSIVNGIQSSEKNAKKAHPRQWAVRLAPGQDPDEVAKRDGFVNAGKVGDLKDTYIFYPIEDTNPAESEPTEAQIFSRKAVRSVSETPNTGIQKKRKRSTTQLKNVLDNSKTAYEWHSEQERQTRVLRGQKETLLARSSRWNTLNDVVIEPIEAASHSASHARVTDNQMFKDPMWRHQGYLLNKNSRDYDPKFSKVSIEAQAFWDRGIYGTGVNIAVVDQFVDGYHPDLVARFEESKSNKFDYSSQGNPPEAVSPDVHGTQCAGVIVAQPHNAVCGVGIAPGARFSAISLIGSTSETTDAEEAMALTHELQWHDIYTSSWGPQDDGLTIDGPRKMTQEALLHGVNFGRKGKGALYVFASGNGGIGDNCNYDGYSNSPYTIAVGGVNINGQMASFSEPCVAHLVMAYGGEGDGAGTGLITAAPDGKCSANFKGTSAAAPLVSGMLALLLETRPDLHWRDVQHLLVHSTIKNDPTNKWWIKNGAGLEVSQYYGFGILNGPKLLKNAETWESLPVPQQTATIHTKGYYSEPMIIPSGGLPAESKIYVSKNEVYGSGSSLVYLEHVKVRLEVIHRNRGKLLVTLTSPSGTVSYLATPRTTDTTKSELHVLEFTTVHNWDEEPWGEWMLQVGEGVPDTKFPYGDEYDNKLVGVLHKWSIELFGRCRTEDSTLDPLTNTFTCPTDMKAVQRRRNFMEMNTWTSPMSIGFALSVLGPAGTFMWTWTRGASNPFLLYDDKGKLVPGALIMVTTITIASLVGSYLLFKILMKVAQILRGRPPTVGSVKREPQVKPKRHREEKPKAPKRPEQAAQEPSGITRTFSASRMARSIGDFAKDSCAQLARRSSSLLPSGLRHMMSREGSLVSDTDSEESRYMSK